MAPSAAPLIKQRYTAGNCTLNLTLQPSALSKWYPQPIAKNVVFELWMANAASEEPTLLAKGDRTLLQAIARYIEHQTHATLTVGQMASSTVGQPRSTTSTATAAQTAPPLPTNVQLPQPLSYLQLCDLSSVLTQSEQATKTLPVSLEVAPAVAPKRKSNLLFFPTGRRAAWASSAAAALFAVGLTTTLWNQTNAPDPASVAETDLATPKTTSNSDDRLRLKKPKENELAAGLPRSTSRNSTPLGQPAPSLPVPTTTPPSSGDQPASAPSNQPSGSPNSSAPASPSPNRSTASAEQSIPPNSPAGNPIGESAPAPEQNGTNAPQEELPPESVSQDDAPAPESADASGDIPDDISVAAAPAPAIARSPDNALDRKIANAEPSAAEPSTGSLGPAAFSSQADEADLPALESAPSQAAARRLSNETEGAIASQESETLTQVQNYFLGQWNADNNLSAPLSYQLQLSSLGEIVSFSAITEGGNAYRDRLLPDSSITFPPSNSAALANGLMLKITVTPDGQVQVEKL